MGDFLTGVGTQIEGIAQTGIKGIMAQRSNLKKKVEITNSADSQEKLLPIWLISAIDHLL